MKKVLLGTSAIALASAFTTPADAVEWEVRVGGYMEQYVAYSETDAESTSGEFDGIENKEDSEIHFRPQITLDNGLTFGATIELEGRTGGDQIDHTFMTVEGSFGILQLGEKDLPPYTMGVVAPDVTFLGINSGSDTKFWGGNLNTFTSTLPQVAVDPQHIAYYSPRLAGFQIGAGYARDGNRATVQSQVDTDSGDEVHDVWGVGANYVNAFGDFNVAISGGYSEADWNSNLGNSGDVKAWGAGINLGYGGFTIGGSYKENDVDGDTAAEIDCDCGDDFEDTIIIGELTDNTVWDAGVSYETGPWGFSFTYINFESDPDSGNDVDIEKFMVGMDYQLAQGVRLGAFGVYGEAKEDLGPGEGSDKDDGWIVGTGVRVDF